MYTLYCSHISCTLCNSHSRTLCIHFHGSAHSAPHTHEPDIHRFVSPHTLLLTCVPRTLQHTFTNPTYTVSCIHTLLLHMSPRTLLLTYIPHTLQLTLTNPVYRESCIHTLLLLTPHESMHFTLHKCPAHSATHTQEPYIYRS